MIEVSAQVVSPSGQDIEVLVHRPACEGCRSTCAGPGLLMALPGSSAQGAASQLSVKVGQRLVLGLHQQDRHRLLWHSLLLPLVGLLAGTLVAARVNPDDVVVLLGASIGFCLGLAACKPFSSNTLHIQEA